MRKKYLSSSLVILFLFTLGSCTKDSASKVIVITESFCDTLEVSFSADVLPVVQLNCAFSGCHDAGTSAGGYHFENYANISSNISDILIAIKHDPSFSPMPKFESQLPDSMIQIFDCWEKQGKLFN